MRQIVTADYDQGLLLPPTVEEWGGPEHPALWRVWRAQRGQVSTLFRRSVRVAVELNLVGLAVQALGGTKIMAASSGRGGFGRAHLEKLRARLETEVREREEEIARAGEEAAAALPADLHDTSELRDAVRAAVERVVSAETKLAHPLEPDAARMEC